MACMVCEKIREPMVTAVGMFKVFPASYRKARSIETVRQVRLPDIYQWKDSRSRVVYPNNNGNWIVLNESNGNWNNNNYTNTNYCRCVR
ncbi:MAG: hypothetical protein EPN85_13600 [Bacteroidetes bacterium]|nr:MAG: hypothetical protein EPN85_13600 [Bacteroidota bacterium]